MEILINEIEPFETSVNEGLSGHEIKETTTDVTDAIKHKLDKCKINGRSTQATNSEMPSPDFPSEIVNVKGKNIFNKNAVSNKKVSTVTLTPLETGVRVATSSAGSYMWARYYIGDLTGLSGKTIRMKCNFTPSGTNKGYYGFGTTTEPDAAALSYLAQTNISGTQLTATIPEITDANRYLSIILYANINSPTSQPNDYVDYTDLIVTIDNADMSYLPYQSISVNVEGKNLIDYHNFSSNDYTTVTEIENGINVNGTYNTSIFIDLPAGTYIFSAIKEVISGVDDSRWRLQYTDDTYAPTTNINSPVEATKHVKKILLYVNFGGSATSINFTNIQLEQGSLITEYEPHKSNTTTINIGDNELCSIGDIKDELFIDNGVWKIKKKIGNVVFNGSETGWSKAWTLTNNTVFQNPYSTAHPTSDDDKVYLSNYFNCISRNEFMANYDQIGISPNVYTANTTYMIIGIPNNIATTLTGFKTWLSTHNVEVYYQLATPTEVTLETTTEVETFEGINIFTVDSDYVINYYSKDIIDLTNYDFIVKEV